MWATSSFHSILLPLPPSSRTLPRAVASSWLLKYIGFVVTKYNNITGGSLFLWKSSKKNDIDTQNKKQQFQATCLIKKKAEYVSESWIWARLLREHFLQKRSDPYWKVMSVKRHQGRDHFQVFLVFNNCPVCTKEYRHWLHGPLGSNYIIRIELVFTERSQPLHYNYQYNYGLQVRKVFLSLPTSVIS